MTIVIIFDVLYCINNNKRKHSTMFINILVVVVLCRVVSSCCYCVCSLLAGLFLLLISPYCHEVTGLQQTGCWEVRLSSRLLHEAVSGSLSPPRLK